MSARAVRSLTFPVELVWPAVMSTVSNAPVLLAFLACQNIIPVEVPVWPAALTAIPVTPQDASLAPLATSGAAERASSHLPPNRSVFPAQAQPSSARLAAQPATWTQATNSPAEWQPMDTP